MMNEVSKAQKAVNADELISNLENQFGYHMAQGAQPVQYATVRGTCLDLAKMIAVICPESEERRMAIRRLNEVMFWANAAIARHT
jgi:hypothetical protein